MKTTVSTKDLTLRSATRAQLAYVYAHRLRRLLEKRRVYLHDLSANGTRLIDRGIFEAFYSLKRLRRIVRARKILAEFVQEGGEVPNFLKAVDPVSRFEFDIPPNDVEERDLGTVVIEGGN